ncbi:hypothetical protein A4R89_04690 [Acetobacter ascendens]|nr:hypothetical protein A4R89_04690 [Acetobacter ascendens]
MAFRKGEIMKKTGMLLGALLAATTAVAPAWAQQQAASTAAVPATNAATAAATQDFGRLSDDGNTAFEELMLARRAIFDGDLKGAKTLITSAQQALDRARTDNTAFQKAEAELMPVKTKQAQTAKKGTGSTTPVAWLPIDGELVLDETVEPTTEKSAAVAAANRHLRAGDPDRASEVLKVSGVDADYVIAAVPLEQTRQDVNHAAEFIKNDPYKASEALRDAENSVRYASVDIQAVSHQQAASGNTSK